VNCPCCPEPKCDHFGNPSSQSSFIFGCFSLCCTGVTFFQVIFVKPWKLHSDYLVQFYDVVFSFEHVLAVVVMLLSDRDVAMPTCLLLLLAIVFWQSTEMADTTTPLFSPCPTSFTTKLHSMMAPTVMTCILKILR